MSVTRRLVIALAALLGLAFAGGVLAGSAQAAPYAPHHLTCSASTSNPAPGGTITIQCSGAHANVTLTIILHSKGIFLGTMTTDSSGAGTASVTLPSGVTGHHVLLIRDPLGGTSAIPIDIGGSAKAGARAGNAGNSDGDPALTGVAVAGIGALGLVLLVGGGLMLLAGRRRKSAV
jgi:hypothetical protein